MPRQPEQAPGGLLAGRWPSRGGAGRHPLHLQAEALDVGEPLTSCSSVKGVIEMREYLKTEEPVIIKTRRLIIITWTHHCPVVLGLGQGPPLRSWFLGLPEGVPPLSLSGPRHVSDQMRKGLWTLSLGVVWSPPVHRGVPHSVSTELPSTGDTVLSETPGPGPWLLPWGSPGAGAASVPKFLWNPGPFPSLPVPGFFPINGAGCGARGAG